MSVSEQTKCAIEYFVKNYAAKLLLSRFGEQNVKKWDIKRNVSPKDVSRLVARLKRGEYGIFVTTSTFSKQTQEEVLIDGYPIKLISGIDLVNMFKHLNLITDNSIKNYWVKNILSGE